MTAQGILEEAMSGLSTPFGGSNLELEVLCFLAMPMHVTTSRFASTQIPLISLSYHLETRLFPLLLSLQLRRLVSSLAFLIRRFSVFPRLQVVFVMLRFGILPKGAVSS